MRFLNLIVATSIALSGCTTSSDDIEQLSNNVSLPPSANAGNTPLLAVYEHVTRKAAHSGNLIVKDTPRRLEVQYRHQGQVFPYVFLLHKQSGDRAEVWSGLDRAGVDTVFHLKLVRERWFIVSEKDTGL
jgi:hypothetical protein